MSQETMTYEEYLKNRAAPVLVKNNKKPLRTVDPPPMDNMQQLTSKRVRDFLEQEADDSSDKENNTSNAAEEWIVCPTTKQLSRQMRRQPKANVPEPSQTWGSWMSSWVH
eukprot:TRINITY_DN67450_c7_g3_i1.p5 TRINITY_DN67450_c7_g3~~TRINITY_DN67450_c7_g3_i1.p5  ORF type:complete len:119 (-),score=10.09 TRINITY_DN67450_c7_g3_i1:2885-3214(-)